MGRRGSETHEKTLREYKQELEEKGARVILLRETSPDGIAVFPDGRICAIEVLGRHHRAGKGWHYGGQTMKHKRRQYAMFDEVLFKQFHYPKNSKNPVHYPT